MGKYEATNTQGLIFSPRTRVYLYRVTVALSALGIYYGFVTAEESGLWLVVASTALGATNSVAAINVPKAGE